MMNDMETKPLIAYDEFAKLDLRVATIVSAARVENSDKLLNLEVSLGENSQRQIIAGLGLAYHPVDLVGQQVVIIANLEPRQLLGLESQGMVLAASGEHGPIILNPVA